MSDLDPQQQQRSPQSLVQQELLCDPVPQQLLVLLPQLLLVAVLQQLHDQHPGRKKELGQWAERYHSPPHNSETRVEILYTH